jgi:hypothetical protein
MDTLPNRVSHCLPPHSPERSRNKLMSAAFTHPRQRARGPLTGAEFSAGMAGFARAVFSGGTVSFRYARAQACPACPCEVRTYLAAWDGCAFADNGA